MPTLLNLVVLLNRVGDKEFVMETKAKLAAKAIGRRELENHEGYELKKATLFETTQKIALL